MLKYKDFVFLYFPSPQLSFVVVVQSLSHVQLFATLWTEVCQAFLSSTISQSLLKFMSTESVMPSNHLVLWLLFLPSVIPSIRVFSNELALHIRWPKYCGSFSISPSNEYSGLISFKIDWFDPLAVQGTLRIFSSTTIQKHQFFGIQLSLQSTFQFTVDKMPWFRWS